MKKEFCAWQDEEVKSLFKFVEVKKSEGLPLIKIFDEFAARVGRRQNSVRNYYYNEIKELTKNEKRKKQLKINISMHVAKTPEHFSKGEEQSVVNLIDKLVKEGYSVRGACLKLAGGDATKMIRFQNKYRLIKKLKTKGVQMGTIIKMPERKTVMTEEDIKALFMGILKLVKKQEAAKAKDEFEQKMSEANNKLKVAVDEIILKTEKIERLQDEIKLLKGRLEQTKEKEIKNRIKFVQSSAAQKLIKEFLLKKQEKTMQEQQALN